MKVKIMQTIEESFVVEVPDGLSGEALDDAVEQARLNPPDISERDIGVVDVEWTLEGEKYAPIGLAHALRQESAGNGGLTMTQLDAAAAHLECLEKIKQEVLVNQPRDVSVSAIIAHLSMANVIERGAPL